MAQKQSVNANRSPYESSPLKDCYIVLIFNLFCAQRGEISRPCRELQQINQFWKTLDWFLYRHELRQVAHNAVRVQ